MLKKLTLIAPAALALCMHAPDAYAGGGASKVAGAGKTIGTKISPIVGGSVRSVITRPRTVSNVNESVVKAPSYVEIRTTGKDGSTVTIGAGTKPSEVVTTPHPETQVREQDWVEPRDWD